MESAFSAASPGQGQQAFKPASDNQVFVGKVELLRFCEKTAQKFLGKFQFAIWEVLTRLKEGMDLCYNNGSVELKMAAQWLRTLTVLSKGPELSLQLLYQTVQL